MIRFIDSIDYKFWAHKRVLLRVDFNITKSKEGMYDPADLFRVEASLETINYLLRSGASIGLISHRADEMSFHDLLPELRDIIKVRLQIVERIEDLSSRAQLNKIALFDNLRLKKGEEANDEAFAKVLTSGFDIYVNDAFSVCHRNHASISAIAKHLPSYGGFLLKKEIETLDKFIEAPKKGKTLLVGGAKGETKIPIIKSFIDKAENVLVGGAVANELFLTRKFKKDEVTLPSDIIIAKSSGQKYTNIAVHQSNIKIPRGFKALDIGPESIKTFVSIIKKSKIVLWNGPMGLAEVSPFDNATLQIAKSLKVTQSIIGGGDTVSFLKKHHLVPSQALVSTGGGAMLSFLAGESLPGLSALGYYDKKNK